MKLSELFDGLEISETNVEDFDIEITNITDDSRRVKQGDLFIALEGYNRDGHGYIGEALEHRAAVIVIEAKASAGAFPYIRVPSARSAFSGLWNNFCGRPADHIKLIAVTGTNGKSTVVSMIDHILNSSGISSYRIGTLNSTLTTPDPPELYPRLRDCREKGVEYVVMEASSHALELNKLSPLRFEVGVFTNLSRDHLDFHENMYSYAKAKSKLFAMCKSALFNFDDKYGRDVVSDCEGRKYSYSLVSAQADFIAKNILLTLDASRFDFLATGELFPIELSAVGSYNAANALCAASVCRIIGIDKKDISSAMRSFRMISGRAEEVAIDSEDYRVFIDYAHTPDAIENLLGSIRQCMSKSQRLVCIFGCGGDRDRGKRSLMGQAATALADYCIITSDNPRSEDPYRIIGDIIKDINGKTNYLIIEDRARAIEYAVHSAREGDILVFCGKGHESYEITASGKREFNEKKIIQDADKERIRIRGNEYYSRRQDENVSCRDSEDNGR